MTREQRGIGKRKRYIILAIILAVILLPVIGFVAYVSDYYHANEYAIQAMASDDQIAVSTTEDGTILFIPDISQAGMIFYPGGKVEYTAYIPLMQACAKRGIMCILLKMPFNLAVFDTNAADGIIEQYPDIETWYIGGHSLGGAMAAAYAADHTDEFDGLILLAAYSTKDLTNSGLSVLSIYGSEDGVLNADKYESSKANLPTNMIEVIIEGGCHAGFGSYGPQDGDGTPTISSEEQINTTANEIQSIISTFS